jgi:hypothetical protein
MNEDIAQKAEKIYEFSIKKENETYALVAVKMEKWCSRCSYQ